MEQPIHKNRPAEKSKPTDSPTAVKSGIKSSLLSLEPRLMFDAAAAATAAEVRTEQVAQEQAEAAVSTEAQTVDGDAHQTENSHDMLQALSGYMPAESRTEVVFVDPTVPNYRELLSGMDPNIEVIMLDGAQDGVEQMAGALEGRTGIDAIHLISHGDAGTLQLGTGTLTAESMSGQYADELATIQQALNQQADILVYGCNFAEGESGHEAVLKLAELTGADVQASTDLTGNALLGGDWDLETASGTIETRLAVADETQVDWLGLLADTTSTTTADTDDSISAESAPSARATLTVTTTSDANDSGITAGNTSHTISWLNANKGTDGKVSLREAIIAANNTAGTDTIMFNISDPLVNGAHTINVQSELPGISDTVFIDGTTDSDYAAQGRPVIVIDGTNAGTGADGLDLNSGSSGSTIKGLVIKNFSDDGIDVDAGSNNNTIELNYIGTNVTGLLDQGNSASGIDLDTSTGNLIQSNVISGNNADGITLLNSDNNTIRANSIGVGSDGTTALGNSGAGVYMSGGSTGNLVGGTGGTDGNIIANSQTRDGIELASSSDVTNRFMGNSIYGNAQLGIDLGSDGATLNDTGDGDGGANYQKNFPVLSSVQIDSPTQITITGTYNSIATARTYRVEFFASPTADASGHGEGQRYLGYTDITTDSSGNATISATLTASVSAGESISATLTDPVLNVTSEFGLNVTASLPPNTAPTDLTLSSNTIPENSAAGTVVGTVTGTDANWSDTQTYSLTDTAGGRFAIHSSTGVLTVADGTLLNYESATSHTVTVRVTDSGGLTYDETFTINLTNINEAPVAADDRAGLTFDGVDDFVDMGTGAVYEVSDTVTMEAWINREPSSQATQMIINKEGEYEVALDADGSLKWAFANTTPGWAWHDTGVVIPVHTWTHIAVTYDHGTITSFVDGVAVEVFAGSGTIGDAHPTKDTLRIGGRENNPANQYFHGQISEVQVWNVARTAGEIANDRSGNLTGTETGLLGYWKFNENAGTNADNLTANSDGTLGGGAAGQTPQWSTYRVAEDSSLTVTGPGVLGNDYDVDGDTLSAVMVTGPSHASSFTLNSDGSFSYTPSADFFGTDSFTYRVNDGTTLSNIATVYIQVDPINDAPTDLSLSANTVAENAATGTVVGTVSGTDPDAGDTQTYALTDTAGGRFAIHSSTGVLTVADGTLLNYESATSHTVTVQVTDAGGLTYDETFAINLTNVNEAPTGADATVTISEDTSHTLTPTNFGFSDVDAGDSLSAVRIDTVPSAGTLTLSGVNVTAGQMIAVADITAGNLLFTPAANANGTGYASFTFSVRDSNNAYDTAPNTLTFNVTTVNDAPVLTPVAPDVTFVEGGLPQVFDATGTIVDADSADFDGGTLTVSISANGTADDRLHIGNFGTGPGQVGLSGSNVTYGGTFVGTVSGGTNGSDPLVVTFNANATPSAVQEVYRSIQFNNVSDSPSTATRTLTIGLTDGDGGTATPQTKLVHVQASNDAPTDLSLSANTVAENAATGTVVGTVSGTDPDAGDTQTYALTDTAGGRFAIHSSTGVLTVADGTLLNYESATSHTVTVQVTDSGGLTRTQVFTISLTNLNEKGPGPSWPAGGLLQTKHMILPADARLGQATQSTETWGVLEDKDRKIGHHTSDEGFVGTNIQGGPFTADHEDITASKQAALLALKRMVSEAETDDDLHRADEIWRSRLDELKWLVRAAETELQSEDAATAGGTEVAWTALSAWLLANAVNLDRKHKPVTPYPHAGKTASTDLNTVEPSSRPSTT